MLFKLLSATIVLLAANFRSSSAQFLCSSTHGPPAYYFKVLESAAIGDVVGNLSLTGGIGQIQLQPDPSSQLALNQTTREIYIIGKLDYETNSKINWKIHCQDGKSQLHLSVTLVVLDDNDNAPEFLQSHYYTNVSELSRIGSTIISGISATDKDEGGHQIVTFSILPGPHSEYLDIPLPIHGVVTLVKRLDYESFVRFDVVIKVEDEHERPLMSYANLTVFVEDEDDLNPVFTQQIYSANTTNLHLMGDTVIPENAIAAYDGDRTLNATLNFHIWDSEDALSIDPLKAIVTTKKKLTGGTLIAVIKAVQTDNSDHYGTAVLKLTVSTETTTLNTTASISTSATPPKPTTSSSASHLSSTPTGARFPPKHIAVNVSEDFPIGHVIHVIGLQMNREETISWQFQLINLNPSFTVHPVGAVSLTRRLDYESERQHELMVKVTDRHSRTSTSVLIVNVLNINEHVPEVSEPQQVVLIKRVPDVQVATINATDRDTNTVLTYTLPPHELYFNINQSGGISTTSNISDLESATYSLLVLVTDNGERPLMSVATVTFKLPTIEPKTGTLVEKQNHIEIVVGLGIACGFLLVILIITSIYIIRRRLYDNDEISKVRGHAPSDAAGLKFKNTLSQDYTDAYTYQQDDVSEGTNSLEDEHVEAINGALVSSMENMGAIDIETDVQPHNVEFSQERNNQNGNVGLTTFGHNGGVSTTNRDSSERSRNTVIPWPNVNGLHKSTSSELATSIALMDDKPEITVYF